MKHTPNLSSLVLLSLASCQSRPAPNPAAGSLSPDQGSFRVDVGAAAARRVSRSRSCYFFLPEEPAALPARTAPLRSSSSASLPAP